MIKAIRRLHEATEPENPFGDFYMKQMSQFIDQVKAKLPDESR